MTRNIKRLRSTTLESLTEIFNALEKAEAKGKLSEMAIHFAILIGTMDICKHNAIDFAIDVGREIKESTS